MPSTITLDTTRLTTIEHLRKITQDYYNQNNGSEPTTIIFPNPKNFFFPDGLIDNFLSLVNTKNIKTISFINYWHHWPKENIKSIAQIGSLVEKLPNIDEIVITGSSYYINPNRSPFLGYIKDALPKWSIKKITILFDRISVVHAKQIAHLIERSNELEELQLNQLAPCNASAKKLPFGISALRAIKMALLTKKDTLKILKLPAPDATYYKYDSFLFEIQEIKNLHPNLKEAIIDLPNISRSALIHNPATINKYLSYFINMLFMKAPLASELDNVYLFKSFIQKLPFNCPDADSLKEQYASLFLISPHSPKSLMPPLRFGSSDSILSNKFKIFEISPYIQQLAYTNPSRSSLEIDTINTLLESSFSNINGDLYLLYKLQEILHINKELIDTLIMFFNLHHKCTQKNINILSSNHFMKLIHDKLIIFQKADITSTKEEILSIIEKIFCHRLALYYNGVQVDDYLEMQVCTYQISVDYCKNYLNTPPAHNRSDEFIRSMWRMFCFNKNHVKSDNSTFLAAVFLIKNFFKLILLPQNLLNTDSVKEPLGILIDNNLYETEFWPIILSKTLYNIARLYDNIEIREKILSKQEDIYQLLTTHNFSDQQVAYLFLYLTHSGKTNNNATDSYFPPEEFSFSLHLTFHRFISLLSKKNYNFNKIICLIKYFDTQESYTALESIGWAFYSLGHYADALTTYELLFQTNYLHNAKKPLNIILKIKYGALISLGNLDKIAQETEITQDYINFLKEEFKNDQKIFCILNGSAARSATYDLDFNDPPSGKTSNADKKRDLPIIDLRPPKKLATYEPQTPSPSEQPAIEAFILGGECYDLFAITNHPY